MTVTKASTCCRQGDAPCACGKFKHSFLESKLLTLPPAQTATCSCGEKSAMQCSCDKAADENTVAGARCSCRARPAGQCTCQNATSENAGVSGSKCQCGSRPEGMFAILHAAVAEAETDTGTNTGSCSCEKASDGAYNPGNEVDFTTKR